MNNITPEKERNYTNGTTCKILNQEYMIGGFLTIFMSRNRVRTWDKPLFKLFKCC